MLLLQAMLIDCILGDSDIFLNADSRQGRASWWPRHAKIPKSCQRAGSLALTWRLSGENNVYQFTKIISHFYLYLIATMQLGLAVSVAECHWYFLNFLEGQVFMVVRRLLTHSALNEILHKKYGCLNHWLTMQEVGPDKGHMYNCHVILSNKGEIKAAYRKVHLFDVDVPNGPILMESRSTAPGKEVRHRYLLLTRLARYLTFSTITC